MARIAAASLIAPLAVLPATYLWNGAVNVVDIFNLIKQGFYGIAADRYLNVEPLFDLFTWQLMTVIYVVTIVIGIPVHVLLETFRIRSTIAYASIGAMGGFAVGLLVLSVREATYCGLYGALIALIFDIVAARTSPHGSGETVDDA